MAESRDLAKIVVMQSEGPFSPETKAAYALLDICEDEEADQEPQIFYRTHIMKQKETYDLINADQKTQESSNFDGLAEKVISYLELCELLQTAMSKSLYWHKKRDH